MSHFYFHILDIYYCLVVIQRDKEIKYLLLFFILLVAADYEDKNIFAFFCFSLLMFEYSLAAVPNDWQKAFPFSSFCGGQDPWAVWSWG